MQVPADTAVARVSAGGPAPHLLTDNAGTDDTFLLGSVPHVAVRNQPITDPITPRLPPCCSSSAWSAAKLRDQAGISNGEEATDVLRSNLQFSARSSEESSCLATTTETLVTSQRKPGILVVDDDAAVRALLDVGLRQYGFAVWQAADGHEALQVYQRNGSEIDLALLDVRMPGLDGPQTLVALSQLNPRIRCCFMTGQAGSYTQDELLKLGAAHIFPKPFQLAEVAQVLATVIGIPLPTPPG